MYDHRLDTFICAADAGSFNKAAEEMYITPSAVIKQINLLEASLGVKLFIRNHRGLILTESGKSLYRDAKYIVRFCGEAAIRAKNAAQEDTNVIRIGTSPMTPPQILVELWPKIHEHCPNIKFQLIPFENTPENAREILGNLGQNIDIVAGIFDETMLDLRKCRGLELTKLPICCAVSVNHHLADKIKLDVTDLYGENLLLMHRGWSNYVDKLRDDLWTDHPEIHITDFDFYNVEIFNRCESSSDILMAVESWASIHPLLRIIPVDWKYSIPYGLLYSPKPSKTVRNFLAAVKNVIE